MLFIMKVPNQKPGTFAGFWFCKRYGLEISVLFGTSLACLPAGRLSHKPGGKTCASGDELGEVANYANCSILKFNENFW